MHEGQNVKKNVKMSLPHAALLAGEHELQQIPSQVHNSCSCGLVTLQGERVMEPFSIVHA